MILDQLKQKGKKAEARDGHDVLKTNSTPLVRAEDM